MPLLKILEKMKNNHFTANLEKQYIFGSSSICYTILQGGQMPNLSISLPLRFNPPPASPNSYPLKENNKTYDKTDRNDKQ